MPAVKSAVRSYRAHESAARDLISTIWNISDRNLEGTAGVISGLVDLFDEEDKKTDLLTAWNGFKIEVRALHPVRTCGDLSNISFSNATNSRNSSQPESVLSGQESPAAGF